MSVSILTITVPNHGFNVGDNIYFLDTQDFNGALNDQTFQVLNVTTNTFSIQANISGGSYVGGGQVYKVFLMNFQTRNDWDVTWSAVQQLNYDRQDSFAFGATITFDIGTIENMFQFKIQDNSSQSAWTIYGADLFGTQLNAEVEDRAVS